ncbi:MAG: hypothetical protein ACRYG8_51690 [Janthinobacterium lividum]
MNEHDDLAFRGEDDSYHRLSRYPYETETNWWSFNIPERKIARWIHAPDCQNGETVTWRIFVWDDEGVDPGRLPYYRTVEEAPMPDDPDLRDITFPHGGYSLKMLELGMKYHLRIAIQSGTSCSTSPIPACTDRIGFSQARRWSSIAGISTSSAMSSAR